MLKIKGIKMKKAKKKNNNENGLKVFIEKSIENSGPVVDLLISGIGLIPSIGPFLKIGIDGVKTALKLYVSRAKCFETKLDMSIVNNFDRLIENEEFAAKLLRTWNSVQKEHMKEKIETYSRLFNNSYQDTEYDEFEELVNMLDSLSIRELKLLMFLDKFHADNKDINPHKERIEIWKNAALPMISKEVGLTENEVTIYYDRLLYKGMCSEYAGFMGQVFSLSVSVLYKKLLFKLINQEFA